MSNQKTELSKEGAYLLAASQELGRLVWNIGLFVVLVMLTINAFSLQLDKEWVWLIVAFDASGVVFCFLSSVMCLSNLSKKGSEDFLKEDLKKE